MATTTPAKPNNPPAATLPAPELALWLGAALEAAEDAALDAWEEALEAWELAAEAALEAAELAADEAL